MMLHRHFAGKAEEVIQEPEKAPEARKVEEGADIMPEPDEQKTEQKPATRRSRKKAE